MIRRIAALAGTATCGLALVFAPSAFATPDVPPACSDAGALAGKDVPLCQDVDTKDGVRARVRVGDIVCVKADVLTHDRRGNSETADARVLIPCPPAGFKDCADAKRHGVHDIPKGHRFYRPGLDEDGDGIACESRPGKPVFVPADPGPSQEFAPKPRPVVADLPVTG